MSSHSSITPVSTASATSHCSLKVCLQSQDDSLIRQTVTLRRTHEYPITDAYISKTHGLFLHSISIKPSAQPCPVTWYKARETKATHVFMYKGWTHASMCPSCTVAGEQRGFIQCPSHQPVIKWRRGFYCWKICILKKIFKQLFCIFHLNIHEFQAEMTSNCGMHRDAKSEFHCSKACGNGQHAKTILVASTFSMSSLNSESCSQETKNPLSIIPSHFSVPAWSASVRKFSIDQAACLLGPFGCSPTAAATCWFWMCTK